MKITDLLNNQIYAKDTLNKQLELKIPPFVLHCFFLSPLHAPIGQMQMGAHKLVLFQEALIGMK